MLALIQLDVLKKADRSSERFESEIMLDLYALRHMSLLVSTLRSYQVNFRQGVSEHRSLLTDPYL